MKVLVTGAAGFIGRALTQRLMSDKREVIAFDKKSDANWTNFIQGDIVSFNFDDILQDVDIVFHLAGLLGTTELFHRIIEAEKINVLGTLNLLESMRRNDVTTIVFTSKPNVWRYNVYTITKENCERYLEMYKEIYGFKTIITRPFNVYGPNEQLIEYRKAIPYFIINALKGKPLEIFGDGQQTLDPIYIDDTVEALIRCSQILPKEIVEIGSPKQIKVVDIAQKIIDLVGSNSEIIYLPMRKGELGPRKICSNGNMQRLLDFTSCISLEEGLRRTIRWYDRHIDDFQKIYEFVEEDFAKP